MPLAQFRCGADDSIQSLAEFTPTRCQEDALFAACTAVVLGASGLAIAVLITAPGWTDVILVSGIAASLSTAIAYCNQVLWMATALFVHTDSCQAAVTHAQIQSGYARLLTNEHGISLTTASSGRAHAAFIETLSSTDDAFSNLQCYLNKKVPYSISEAETLSNSYKHSKPPPGPPLAPAMSYRR